MTKLLFFRRLVGVGTVLVLLAGCGHNSPGAATVTGQLALDLDNATLPDGATARVSLIQHGDTPGDERIVAERSLHHLGKLPITFSIEVGQALLDRGGQYGMRAQIMNVDGRVIWETEAPQAVPVFNAKSVELTLEPYQYVENGGFVTYHCGDGFSFQLARDAQGAFVRLGTRQINLRSARSLTPQSMRYVDEHNDEIVIGTGVTSIYFDGISHHDCERHAPPQHAVQN